jgi:hypothetical protein
MKQDDIFTINDNAPIESNVRSVLSYTITGKEDFRDNFDYPRTEFENNKNTHAKCVHVGNSIRYYIKINHAGRLFNPIGMFDESQRLRESRHAGRPNWTWRQTNEDVFMLYIEFLKSKNSSYLLNAERKIVG